MSKSCLLLVAHGSKNPEWAKPFRDLAQKLQQEVGEEHVYLCFIENVDPLLPEAAERIAQSGITKCRLLPLLMAPGTHILHDIPVVVKQIEDRHPGFSVEILPPIGQHPAFIELMRSLARDAVAGD